MQLERRVEHLDIHTGSLRDQAALRRYFMRIRATLGPIKGVVHSAGVYSDAAAPGFVEKSLARMQSVWSAKIDGIESLAAVFKADPLDFFVSFSSMTGLVPHLARGAADYAMANAYLDFFTSYRNHENGDGRFKTIIWSDWNETGGITRVSAETAASVADTFERIGMRTFSNSEGRALFDCAMASNEGGTLIVGHVDPGKFDAARADLLLARPLRTCAAGACMAEAEPSERASLLAQIERWEAEKRAGAIVPVEQITDVVDLEEIRMLDPGMVSRLHSVMFGEAPQAAVSSGPRFDYTEAITTTVKGVLKLKAVSPEQPLQNYGLDSISATVLATRLEKMLDIEIRPQWLIEFPTIQALARHLTARGGR